MPVNMINIGFHKDKNHEFNNSRCCLSIINYQFSFCKTNAIQKPMQ